MLTLVQLKLTLVQPLLLHDNILNIFITHCVQVQGDDATIADSTEAWASLKMELPDNIITSEYFKKQYKIGLTPLASAANILHPKYKGMVGFLCFYIII